MFEDHTSPLPTNNKRDLYQDQSPPKEGDLVKWARLSRGTSTGTSTHLLKLYAILSSQISHVSQKALAYLQNILKVEKIEFFYEATFYTY